MKKMLILLIAASFTLGGCSLAHQQVKGSQSSGQNKAVDSNTVACSKEEVPADIDSIHTTLNNEKQLLTATWKDKDSNQKIVKQIDYSKGNCSDSVDRLLQLAKKRVSKKGPIIVQEDPPIETGVVDQVKDWQGHQQIDFTNGWIGKLHGEIPGDYISVAVGVNKQDVLQGELFLSVHNKRNAITKVLSTPTKHGTIKISAFDGFTLTLTAKDGFEWEFDALTATFNNEKGSGSSDGQKQIPEQIQIEIPYGDQVQIQPAYLFESVIEPYYMYVLSGFSANSDKIAKEDRISFSSDAPGKTEMVIKIFEQEQQVLINEAKEKLAGKYGEVKEDTSLRNEKFFQNGVLLTAENDKEKEKYLILPIGGKMFQFHIIESANISGSGYVEMIKTIKLN